MNKIQTTFSLTDVSFAVPQTDGTTEPTWVDVPGVTMCAFKGEVAIVDQYGDNRYIQSHRYNQKGSITVKGEMSSFEVLELVTRNTASSGGGGAGIIRFGTDTELQPQVICVRAKTQVVKEDGSAGVGTFYAYRCQVNNPWSTIAGYEYGKTGEIQFELTVYKHNKDHKGVSLSEFCLGHLEMP